MKTAKNQDISYFNLPPKQLLLIFFFENPGVLDMR